MSNSNENTTRRRSDRLFKSLDLASSSKFQTKKESLFDNLKTRPEFLVSKVEKTFNKKNQRSTKTTQVQEKTEIENSSTDDDFIVLSSDDDDENSKKIEALSVSTNLSQNNKDENLLQITKKKAAYRKSRASADFNPLEDISEIIQVDNTNEKNEKESNKIQTVAHTIETIQQDEIIAVASNESLQQPQEQQSESVENEPIQLDTNLKSVELNIQDSTATCQVDQAIEDLQPEINGLNEENTTESSDVLRSDSLIEIVTTNDKINAIIEPEAIQPESFSKSVRTLSCVIISNSDIDVANSKLSSLDTNKYDDSESILSDNETITATAKKTLTVQESNSEVDSASEYEDDLIVSAFKNKWCVCDNNWSSNNDKKMCDNPKCGQWYHLSCLGYTKEQILQMTSKKKLEQSEKFICPVCKDDQKFIDKHKKAIDFRRKKYSIRKSSSSSTDEDEEEAEESEGSLISLSETEDEDILNSDSDSIENNESDDTDEYSLTDHEAKSSKEKSSIAPNSSAKIHNQIQKQKKLISELSEKDKQEKIHKLKTNHKQPNQTKLLDTNTRLEKAFKRQHSSLIMPSTNKLSKNTSFKSIIDKTTSVKEQSKIATTSGKLKTIVLKSPISASTIISKPNQQLIDSKQCQSCKKQFLNVTRSVPSKVVQEQMLFESNIDELKTNWSYSIYCDDKCISSYIENELVKREKNLSELSKQKESNHFETKKKYICLLDHVTKNRHVYVPVLNKSGEDLRKDIYNKISKQPKLFIVELNYLEYLLNAGSITKPNVSSINIIKKSEIKKKLVSNSTASGLLKSTQSIKVQRSISTPTTVKTTSKTDFLKPVTKNTTTTNSNDYRGLFRDSLLKGFKARLANNTEIKIKPNELDDLIANIELSFHNHFDRDVKSYNIKARSIIYNLNQQTSNFYSRILNGQIKPNELPTIKHNDMLSEDRVKQLEQEKIFEIEQLRKHNDEINFIKLHRMKKTHKGEEYIENTFDPNDFDHDKISEKNSDTEKPNENSTELKEADINNLDKSDSLKSSNKISSTVISPINRSLSVIEKSVSKLPLSTQNAFIFPSMAKNSLNEGLTPVVKVRSTTNNENTKEKRHDPDFESEDEDDNTSSIGSRINNPQIFKATEKNIFDLNTNETNDLVKIPTEIRPISLQQPLTLSIPTFLPKIAPVSTNEKVKTSANLIEGTFDLNSSYIAPHSPPIVSDKVSIIEQNKTDPLKSDSNKTNWSGQIILNSAKDKTFFKAQILPTVKYDSSIENFEKALVSKLKLEHKIEFNLVSKHHVYKTINKQDSKQFNFWNYLTRIKKELSVPLLFFNINSNGPEKNSRKFDQSDRTQFITMTDSDGFFLFKNELLDRLLVYEYQVPDEFKNLIGYFYVTIIKSKPGASSQVQQWFPENLSIPLDRSKEVVLGILIDNESKLKYSLPADFSYVPAPSRIVLLPPSLPNEDHLKRKADADLDENKKKKTLNEIIPEQISTEKQKPDGSPNSSLKKLRDPRLLRQQTSKSNEASNLIVDQTVLLEQQTVDKPNEIQTTTLIPRKENVNSKKNELETNKKDSDYTINIFPNSFCVHKSTDLKKPILNELKENSTSLKLVEIEADKNNSAPIQNITDTLNAIKSKQIRQETKLSDFFHHIISILENVDKNDVNSRQVEIIKLYNEISQKTENNTLTATEKKILLEKYCDSLPDFAIIIKRIEETKETNSSNTLSNENKLPPAKLWQGESKESFENLLQLHKSYAKNKNITNFTFENENWYLDKIAFNLKNPDMETDENDKKKSNENLSSMRFSSETTTAPARKVVYQSQTSERFSRFDSHSSNNNNLYKNNPFNTYHNNKRKSRSRSRNKRDSNNKIARTERE